jgi:hypothetical protein
MYIGSSSHSREKKRCVVLGGTNLLCASVSPLLNFAARQPVPELRNFTYFHALSFFLFHASEPAPTPCNHA